MSETIKASLKYTKEHEWVQDMGEYLRIGITHHAQDQLGDVVYLELPAPGDRIESGDTFGVVEIVKAVSDLYAPISGEVVAINAPLVDTPEVINTSPYDSGWMLEIKPDDKNSINDLMSAEAYKEFVENGA